MKKYTIYTHKKLLLGLELSSKCFMEHEKHMKIAPMIIEHAISFCRISTST